MNNASESEFLLRWLSARSRRMRDFGRDAVDRILSATHPIDNGVEGRAWERFSRYFLPLLRLGHVEQVSERRYRVCPPILRWHAESECASWFGARAGAALEKFEKAGRGRTERLPGHPGYPQRWRIWGSRETCAAVADELGVVFSDKPILPFFRCLPSISQALTGVSRPEPLPKGTTREDRRRLEKSGCHSLRIGNNDPWAYWWVPMDGAPPRYLPDDESICMARWHAKWRRVKGWSGSEGLRYESESKRLIVPIWSGVPLPTVVERLLNLETGGPEESEQFQFASTPPDVAVEALRVLAQ
jgi:hypothetical protein